MDAAGPLVETVKCLGPSIFECMKNHMRLDEGMNILKKKLEELNCQEKDRKLQRDSELRFGKILKETVKKWFEDVEKIKDEIKSIEEEVKEGKCLRRSCLAKIVDKKIQEVSGLLQKGILSDDIFINKPPKRGLELPTTELVGEIDVRDTIWSCLMGDEVAKIGVYGLGGVGKTTIMKQINNQLLREEKFDYVIWVTVSKDYEVSRIESDIASTLDESITDLDKTRRAAKIFEMLRDKRFVLILDEVWKRFDLEDVGIPEALLNNGCKLVLTTRSMDVCRSMGFKMVKVNPLGEEEARSLFLKKVGFGIFNDRNLGYIANLVLGKCGGLPLAISAVGSRMTDVGDIQIWRAALNELKQGNWSDMEDEVLELLKVSYDQLGDVKVQRCFLYCFGYPENKEIPKEELIKLWISKGYVNDMGSREANLDKGHTILSRLESNCLLEKYGDCSVKMHALIRDMALYISKENGS